MTTYTVSAGGRAGRCLLVGSLWVFVERVLTIGLFTIILCGLFQSFIISASLSDPTFVVSSQRDHAKESFKAHTSVDRIVRDSNLYYCT